MKEYTLILGLLIVITAFATGTNAEEACPNNHWTCTVTKNCIPLTWKCDNEADCGEGDNSDEVGCAPKTCASEEFICKEDGQCIPGRWQCDGDEDCKNGTDEHNSVCDKCKVDQFTCSNGHCIPGNQECDGIENCPDASDEKNCSTSTTSVNICGPDMFMCKDKSCIVGNWECDGDHDCLDKSDEHDNCPEIECKPDQMKCVNGSRCIDKLWQCDGDFDCEDHSDEPAHCSSGHDDKPCSAATEFTCKNKDCINRAWECDGDPDCIDNSDEHENCTYHCYDGQFMCESNKACISMQLKCDRFEDCQDGSDERNCEMVCNHNEFDCLGDGKICIDLMQVCDGINNCPHREDEDSAICKPNDPCEMKKCSNHSHCERAGVDAHGNAIAKCECNSGYEWEEDLKHCKDIDECDRPGTCSQECYNTRGGYSCKCLENYTLERHHFCRATGEQAWLYYTNRRDIRRMRADSRYMEVIVEETTNSIALDIDYKRGLMFWTDSAEELIIRAKVSPDQILATEQTNIVEHEGHDTFSPDGLAVDWLYQNIYWTDTGSNKIKVANYDGNKTKVLINSELDDPRAICVDPENGYMYWTDWGYKPKIEKSGMDGNDRKTIVNEGYNLLWPNGLTIDYVSRRIYWIDTKLHLIGSANLDGSDQIVVLVDNSDIVRPYSIAVFEDSVFWTDWHTNSIRSVHKFTGRSAKTLSLGSYSVMDIKVYQELKQDTKFQDQATALCAAANCEFMCLPKAKLEKQNASVSCVCKDNEVLNSDKRTCKSSGIIPSTTKKAEATTKASVPKITTPSVTQKSEAPVSVHVTTQGPEQTTTVGRPEKPESTGHIAVIAGVIAVVILIAVFAVGLFVYRRLRTRSKKSMNFDNPVYRKTTTTDDSCTIPREPQLEPLTLHHEKELNAV